MVIAIVFVFFNKLPGTVCHRNPTYENDFMVTKKELRTVQECE